jgi:hypothetical protein
MVRRASAAAVLLVLVASGALMQGGELGPGLTTQQLLPRPDTCQGTELHGIHGVTVRTLRRRSLQQPQAQQPHGHMASMLPLVASLLPAAAGAAAAAVHLPWPLFSRHVPSFPVLQPHRPPPPMPLSPMPGALAHAARETPKDSTGATQPALDLSGLTNLLDAPKEALLALIPATTSSSAFAPPLPTLASDAGPAALQPKSLITLSIANPDGSETLGVKTPAGVVDVAAAARALGLEAPLTMDELLREHSSEKLHALVAAALAKKVGVVDESSIKYGRLFKEPKKIVVSGAAGPFHGRCERRLSVGSRAAAAAGAGPTSAALCRGRSHCPAHTNHPPARQCVGLNFRKHAEESHMAAPRVPPLFNKYNNALAPHLTTVKLPPSDVAYKVGATTGTGLRDGRQPAPAARGIRLRRKRLRGLPS